MTYPRATRAIALVLSLLPTLATAGPWARQPGTGFVALSREQGAHHDSWNALYAEYGLPSRFTLGLDLGRNDADDSTALVTLQRALSPGDSPQQVALSLGIGRIQSAGGSAALSQIGLSWGRGVSVPQPGWVSLDMRYRIAARDLSTPLFDTAPTIHRQSRAALKADLTLGLKPSPRFWPLGQIQLTRAQGGAVLSRLSLGFVTPFRPGLRLEGAFLTPISGGGKPLVKIGTWLEF